MVGVPLAVVVALVDACAAGVFEVLLAALGCGKLDAVLVVELSLFKDSTDSCLAETVMTRPGCAMGREA
jgi:hypothetical protein